MEARLREVARDWDLTLDGPVLTANASVVAPVISRTGEALFLKVGLPHDDAEHEHLALQHWHGRGAVRLHRADPRRWALLLDRLGSDLSNVPDDEACRVVAGLYTELHIAPMPQLRDQADDVRRWISALERDAQQVPVPRRLVEQAISRATDLTAEPATAVLHNDLHYGNVLQAQDGQWLAIDPKPTNGDPAYELEPMLRNRFDEYGTSINSVRDDIRYRFFVLFDSAGFDEERARDWVIVRSVIDAHWTYETAVEENRPLSAAEREHVTRCVTIAKAVQD